MSSSAAQEAASQHKPVLPELSLEPLQAPAAVQIVAMLLPGASRPYKPAHRPLLLFTQAESRVASGSHSAS